MTFHTSLFLIHLATAACSGAPSEAMASSLRERRLDGLLELFCRKELAARESDASTPTLAIELARSLAIRASETADAEARTKTWRSADAVLAQAISKTDDPAAQAELVLQRAAVAYSEGDWLRQWDELHGRVDDAPSATSRFQRAVDLLSELTRGMKASGGVGRTSEERTRAAQFRQLSFLAGVRLGAARIALARSLAKDDPKRKEELAGAIDTLTPLASIGGEPEVSATAALALSEALRESGRLAEARETLDRLAASEVDTATSDRVLAERVELLLAEDRLLEALDQLHQARRSRPDPPPEWEYLYLKILLQQAKSMRNDATAVGKLQASALRQLRILESLPDPVWLRRGEVLLSQHSQYLLLRDSTEYRRAAEILSRSGDYAKAAEVYHRAAEQAGQRKDEANAITLLEESARSWEKAGSHANARDVYTELAHREPDGPSAPEALLRAAIHARLAYLSAPTAENYATIDRLCDEHQKRFPSSETSGEIHYLRGTLRKAERKYEEAIREFLSIGAEHRLRRPGLIAAGRCYETWKAPLTADAAADGTLGHVIAFLESLLSPLASGATALSEEERAEVLVRLAKFLLDLRVDRAVDAQGKLEEVLGDPSTPHHWRQDARGYLILAHVRQSHYAAAEQLAEAHANGSPPEILVALDLLQQRAEQVSELERQYIGRVQWKLIQRVDIPRTGLSPEERLRWELATARIDLNLGNDGRLADATNRLKILREEHPRDPRILELLGHCLGRQKRHEAAVEIWRTLIRGLPEGSQGWYRAKLNLIVSLRRMGNPAEAKKVLDLLEALYPDLGGPQFRERFLAERENFR